MKQATSETELFTYLDQLIQAARQQGSRMGYFPVCYRYVATNLYAQIKQGAFQHPAIIDRLTLGLFNRYFAALQYFQAGELPTRAWQVAFEAAQSSLPTVGQQIMININPHINLDLGIVVARTCTADRLPAIHADFLVMTNILAPLVDTIVASLGKISPLFGALYGPAQNIPINFTVSEMGRHAWNVAQKLSTLSEPEQVRTIAQLDAQVALIGCAIVGLTPALAAFRLTEHGTVDDVIDLLAQLGAPPIQTRGSGQPPL